MLRIMVFLFHFVLSRFETGEHRGESCCHPSGTPRVIREKMIKSFAPKAIAKHQSSNANIALCYFISFNALEPSCLINCKIFLWVLWRQYPLLQLTTFVTLFVKPLESLEKKRSVEPTQSIDILSARLLVSELCRIIWHNVTYSTQLSNPDLNNP